MVDIITALRECGTPLAGLRAYATELAIACETAEWAIARGDEAWRDIAMRSVVDALQHLDHELEEAEMGYAYACGRIEGAA